MATDTFATSRRALLRQIKALPLFGYFAAQDVWAKARKAAARASSADIYTRIGVTPIINARGTWTYLTGSLELPEVKAAKQAAGGTFRRRSRDDHGGRRFRFGNGHRGLHGGD